MNSCSKCNFSGKTKESREKHIKRDHSHTVTIDDDSKHSVIKNKENNVPPFEELRKHAQLKTAHQAQQDNTDPKHVCDQCNFKTFKISALNTLGVPPTLGFGCWKQLHLSVVIRGKSHNKTYRNLQSCKIVTTDGA